MNWVSVKDRLPAKDEEVLIYYVSEIKHLVLFKKVTTAFFEEDGWRLFSDTYADHVSHWMPLPKPPKA